jgi:hypothetical protein
MTIIPGSRIEKTENTLVQELHCEAVLLNLDNNQYYRLDEISLRMFNVVISSSNLGHAMKTLSAEFDVVEDKLWDDLVKFLVDLEKSGLIQVLNE